MISCGQALVDLLAQHEVETVFGIPGVHTLELYRGLAASGLRHVTPRHEQGAGFMADGWGRVSGRPGVCFVITGPGVTNVLTPMGQAYHDSKPLLIVSAAVAATDHGRGTIHDLPDQAGLTAAVTAFSHSVRDPEELPDVLARAWEVFQSARPGPSTSRYRSMSSGARRARCAVRPARRLHHGSPGPTQSGRPPTCCIGRGGP